VTTELAPGCPVHASFDPLSPAHLDDPYAIMAALPLAEAPIFYAPSIDYYVVTRYADVAQVFEDPAAYSAAVAQAPLVPLSPEALSILLVGGHKPPPTMVSLDEPDHARLRRPTARAFAAKRVNDMVPTIRRVATELLDAIAPRAAAGFDVVGELAFPLPAYIVFSLMGVPAADFPQLKRWCGYRAALGWGRPNPGDQVEIATNMAAYRGYLRALVDDKRAQRGDDLTSDLLAIHDEDAERLSLAEIASILFSLSFAGHETTTGLIGNTVRRLLEVPERWDEIARHPPLIAAAVDECLRFDPSVPVWRRITTRSVTLAGVELPRGAKLFLWLAAANRDGSVFPEPERFDLHRGNADQHLSFGRGLHYCLGAHLGKLEARCVLEELVTRFPRLRLVPGQQLSFHPNISFRGPQHLQVWIGS
jgi:cytochrome P450